MSHEFLNKRSTRGAPVGASRRRVILGPVSLIDSKGCWKKKKRKKNKKKHCVKDTNRENFRGEAGLFLPQCGVTLINRRKIQRN